MYAYISIQELWAGGGSGSILPRDILEIRCSAIASEDHFWTESQSVVVGRKVSGLKDGEI